MDNKIRVLHVLGKLNRGGAETMVMNLYRNIDRSKIQFDFVVHTEEQCDYNSEIISMGGKIYSIPRYTGSNHLDYKKSWNNFFENHPEYKIIHGHVRSTASIYLNIAKKYGLTTIAHSHSTSSGTGLSAIIKNIYQHRIRYTADYLFACSRVAGEWLFGKKACNEDNFAIINNAIETRKYIFNNDTREKIREEFQIGDKFVVGHVGRFCEAKNHNFLIDVFKEIYNKNKNSILLLVGDGELKQSIMDKVDKLGLQECVIFTGVRPDVPDLLQAMDLFLFPSLYEGLPVTIVETQAAGLPSLISDEITKEVKLTPLVKYISLNNGANFWANEAFNYINNHIKRKNTFEDLVKAGYDIQSISNWYQDFLSTAIKDS